MELVKKNIHMNRQKNKAVTQITLDDDFNVPDTKPDIEKIIQAKASIKIDEVNASENMAAIRGALQFEVLYMSDSEGKIVHSLNGKLPFDEKLNLDGAENGDNVRFKWELEDLSAGIINSRKLSIQTIVTFMLTTEELYDEETAVEISGDETMEYRNKGIDVMQMQINKKDTFRIKDEVVVPPNQPNVHEILWDSIDYTISDIKLTENKIVINGELKVFLLYQGEGDEKRVQWLDTTVPFSGAIDCFGCNEQMISDIDVSIKNKEMEIRPDYDGEERVIGLDIVLELDMKLYEEEHVEILADVYGTEREITPIMGRASFESLLVKNFSKCRAGERLKIKNEQPRILQICHSEGNIKIDDVRIVENGIEVEGAVDVKLLYVTSDDKMPFSVVEGMLPFHHLIEARGIDENCIYNLQTDVEQISSTMIDSEEIEVKLVLDLKVLVLRKLEEDIIADITESALDLEKLQNLPGIVGYIVKEGDSLWKIGKQYYMTVADIKEINSLTSDEVKKGDMLIIIKNVTADPTR